MSRIADDVFLLLLDERSGQPRASPRIAGLAVASALLAELVVAGCLGVRAGRLAVLDAPAPRDDLAFEVLELLARRQRDHPEVRTWVDYLGRDAVERVGRRLEAAGVVQVGRRRRLTGSRAVYQPVDSTAVMWPSIRLARMLTGLGEPTLHDLTCLGLISVCGLVDQVFWDEQQHGGARAAVPGAVRRLPGPVAQLLAVTESAVADAVLTGV